ncbi:MAG: hypothetical protein LBS20_16405 [Prevotella sp.]|jgi:hypothetical protein|nr:hypothetical protein [Prevotella sp.]
MGKTAIFSKLTGALPLLAVAIVLTGCSEEQQSGVNLNTTGREITFRALDTRPAKAATTTVRTLTSFTISGISRVTWRILKNGLDEILPESLIFRKMKV